MNNLFYLSIICGLCWKFSFSLKKQENSNGINCGQLKMNTRVETVLRSQRRSRLDKTIGFTWTVFISKKDSPQKEPKEYDDYYDYDDFEDNLLCKGFLIHPQVVITTARCIEEHIFNQIQKSDVLKNNYKMNGFSSTLNNNTFLENIEIRNGGWIPLHVRPLIFTIPPLISEQIRYVSNVSIHPNYNCSSMESNHALLLLSERFDMNSPDIGVMCLSDTDTFTLQCEDVYNSHSADQGLRELCGTDYNLKYREKFMICPKSVDGPNNYYYAGLYRYLVISSHERTESGSYFDHFVGSIDWVESFLLENGINDTLPKI